MASTLSDIAREVGLATSTVADILRGRPGYSADTRKRTLEAARRLDYTPNHLGRSLRRKSSLTIGVLAHLSATGVNNATLKAIADGLTARGYMPLFCNAAYGPGSEEQALRQLRDRSLDGVILESIADLNAIRRVLPPELPCVVTGSVEAEGIPSVVADRSAAVAEGVRWLAGLGHRRIAFFSSEIAISMRSAYNTQGLKIKGYQAAMRELGLNDEELLIDFGSTNPGEGRAFVVRNAGLFKGITAVLTGDDRLAIETISGLADIGLRVPEDCSVIGFNNTEYCAASRPRLTSFDCRRADIGAKAVSMVLDLIMRRPVENVTFVPELIVRESVGPASFAGAP